MLSSSVVVAAMGVVHAASAMGQPGMVISEWMYGGSSPTGGEFIELTNLSAHPVDLSGWSIDDSNRVPGSFALDGAGILQPGESVVVTQDDAAAFRKQWSLSPGTAVIGGLGVVSGNNLGRNDEINVYDAKGQLVDRLTYGDQAIPGSIRTQHASGIPQSWGALGANDVLQWRLSALGDDAGTWTSAFGDRGSPGTLTLPAPTDAMLSINEAMSLNASTIVDEDGDHSDWIELHNHGESEISLMGFGLSDDPADPFRWRLPEVVLPAGGQLLIFASGKDRISGPLHTNFSIAQDGETLSLTHPGGQLVDSVTVPALPVDVSYGRQPNGTGPWWLFADPTPGQPNTGQGYLSSGPVTLSRSSGMYEDAFDLVLSSDPDALIHFTLDGSIPTSASALYTGPIRVSSREGEPNGWSMHQVTPNENWVGGPSHPTLKATVVRAAAIRPGALPGPVRSATFLVGPGVTSRYALPVVSVIADPQDLFGHVGGIYALGQIYEQYYNPAQTWWFRPANYTQRGDSWERVGHLTLFESANEAPIDQGVGYRIQGGITRSYQRKSLRVYARSEYGPSTLAYRVFPEGPLSSFKRLIIRNSGQDWNQLLFKDVLLQGLVSHRDIEVQASRHAIVLINGEYWGIHDIRERQDQHYLASHFGIDPDAVDILDTVFSVSEGSSGDYEALYSLVTSQDPADPAVYEDISSRMDVGNHALYGAIQVLIGNHDWPQNNIAKWRPQDRSIRWRWLLYDTDAGYIYNQVDNDSIGRLMGLTHPDAAVFNRLLRNAEYRESFISLLADLMNHDLSTARVNQRIDSMDALLRPYMLEHIRRWPVSWGTNSISNWNWYQARLREFARDRPSRVRAHVVKNFELPGTCEVTVPAQSSVRGTITVNTLEMPASSAWSGIYFQGVPVTLRAQPAPDFRFDGVDELGASPDGNVLRADLKSDTQTLTPRFRLRADLDGNEAVDGVDLGILLGHWGSCSGSCVADITRDGEVDSVDLAFLLARWGPVP